MAKPSLAQGTGHGNKYIVLLLSLNLILLAFFILLNALSEYEARKSSAALDSVNRAFRGSIQTPPNATSAAASLGVLALPKDLINELGSLFESFVPSAKANRTARATVMTVDLPARALFRPGQDDIRPERKVLIRRVARALMRDPGGIMKYELAFEHGTPDAEATRSDGAEAARAVRRADAIARYLIRQSIPEAALSIGLRPGDPDHVRFILRLRDDPAPVPGRSES